MRDRFEARLPGDAVVVFGAGAKRLPNTSNFALARLTAETAVIAMDLEGSCDQLRRCVLFRQGTRPAVCCVAMGVAPDLAKAALRVSFGHESKESDVDEVLNALNKIAARRARSAA